MFPITDAQFDIKRDYQPLVCGLLYRGSIATDHSGLSVTVSSSMDSRLSLTRVRVGVKIHQRQHARQDRIRPVRNRQHQPHNNALDPLTSPLSMRVQPFTSTRKIECLPGSCNRPHTQNHQQRPGRALVSVAASLLAPVAL